MYWNLIDEFLKTLGLIIYGVEDLVYEVDDSKSNPEYSQDEESVMCYWGEFKYYYNGILIGIEDCNGRQESTYSFTDEGKTILKEHLMKELAKKFQNLNGAV